MESKYLFASGARPFDLTWFAPCPLTDMKLQKWANSLWTDPDRFSETILLQRFALRPRRQPSALKLLCIGHIAVSFGGSHGLFRAHS
jgi:hypothetical protein